MNLICSRRNLKYSEDNCTHTDCSPFSLESLPKVGFCLLPESEQMSDIKIGKEKTLLARNIPNGEIVQDVQIWVWLNAPQIALHLVMRSLKCLRFATTPAAPS